jgi:hypothetical protein
MLSLPIVTYCIMNAIKAGILRLLLDEVTFIYHRGINVLWLNLAIS